MENYGGAKWEQETGRLLLWQKSGDQWRTEVVFQGSMESTPNLPILLLDRRGQPCVIIGRTGTPDGWVKAFRPNDSLTQTWGKPRLVRPV